jgi:hypothetical protein
MSKVNQYLSILVIILFAYGCEGPAGSQGPVGPQGEQGTQGERGQQGLSGESSDLRITLIERTFRSEDFRADVNSFVLTDFRIRPETVLEIYVRGFFINTGDVFYMSPVEFAATKTETGDLRILGMQILEGSIRFLDLNQVLLNETIVVALVL